MVSKHYLLPLMLVLILTLVLAKPIDLASAQEDASLAALTIRIWPEYDQPSALVFYIGRVAEGTALPVVLRFQLPPGAVLNATAYVDEQTGSLLTAPPQIEGSTVTMTSPNGSFHVEFYDSGLKVNGDQRTYSLVWSGDYPITRLMMEVEQPIGARDMVVEPAGGLWVTGSNGLQSYVVTQGDLQAGQQATLSVSYAKTGNALTVDSLPPSSSAGSPQTQSGPVGGITQTIGLGILLTVLLIAVGGVVFYYIRRNQGSSRASKATGRRFCTQCGQALGTGDRFCRHCGAKLG